jgi:bile acid:Na+ symporter, BASS family
MTGDQPTRIGDRAAEFVRRHFLWLLVACYILAVALPAPGIALRSWEWRAPAFAKVSLASLLLLAVMLFIAALFTELNQLRIVSRHPFVLLSALVAVWLAPALLVFTADWIMPSTVGGQSTAGLIIGFALVASMPVANSSIGWTQSAGGNLGLGLALVVVSIVLCPWITPNLLRFFGKSLAESAQDCEALVNQFSGVFFIIWVILPTAAGLACRYLVAPERLETARPWLTLASAAALLVLNYINSVLALPKAYHSTPGLLLTTAILAVALGIMGIVLGALIAWLLRLRPETRTALMFGLSMKHTGLALILASVVLGDQPLAIFMIVLATIMQHLLAGVVQWYLGAVNQNKSTAPGSAGG